MKNILFILSIALCLSLLSIFPAYSQTAPATDLDEDASSTFSLRTNMASWMFLTPNAGVEWRPSQKIGLLLNGSYARWDWLSKQKRHRIWEVNPQVRRYLGKWSDSYIGAEFKTGQYSLKWSSIGRQADFMGGGIVFGHQFHVGSNFLIDVGLGLGYLHLTNREEYERTGKHDKLTAKKADSNYWGPTSFQMALVWKIK